MNKNNIVIQGCNSVSSSIDFNSYKQKVLSFPNLSEEAEKELFLEYKKNNCLESAQKLIISQLKNVFYISSQYKNYGLPEEDLVQEGTIGLMKAVKNYDLKYKVRLYTYSLLWIKSEIQNYIIKNWKIVKIGTTKNFKKLFFNYRKIQKELLDMGVSKKELNFTIQKRLNVSSEEIEHINQYFNNSELTILEENFKEDEAHTYKGYELVDYNSPAEIVIEEHDTKVRQTILEQCLSELNERERSILKDRFFQEDKLTHKEIANKLNISSERVRQIEMQSIKKLKTLLDNKFNIQEIF